MNATTKDQREEGVEFLHENDGSITVRDIETGVGSFGETKAEAPAMLAEALALPEDGGDPVTDDALREFSFNLDDDGDRELPGSTR